MKQKQKLLEKLKLYYVLVFILGALIIAPTHIFPQPYFMYARFPHYLETMGPFFGLKWTMTFEIYHYALYVLGATICLNALGVLFYPKLNKITIATSVLGIIMFSLMILFFFVKFIEVNFYTAIAFGLYSMVLLFLSLFTFRALTK